VDAALLDHAGPCLMYEFQRQEADASQGAPGWILESHRWVFMEHFPHGNHSNIISDIIGN